MAGLVLEAPFNCMREEVMTFKAARALTWIMDIDQTLETAGVMFETNKWLPAVKVTKKPRVKRAHCLKISLMKMLCMPIKIKITKEDLRL